MIVSKVSLLLFSTRKNCSKTMCQKLKLYNFVTLGLGEAVLGFFQSFDSLLISENTAVA
uniref:Uncharacterized protein n=1 Tax=Arion vulgaris TaxID=1028688 RepID=A0A0B6ZDV7_9EUPU